MLKGTTLKLKLSYRLNLRIDVRVKKNKTILKFFGVLADRCGSVEILGYEWSEFEVQV